MNEEYVYKQKLPLNRMLTARGFRYLGKRANVSSWYRDCDRAFVRRLIGKHKPIVILKLRALEIAYYSDDPSLRTWIMSDFTIMPEPTEEVKWNEH